MLGRRVRSTTDQVVIRLVVKTQPLEQWRVARELRARIKAALDDAGIAAPCRDDRDRLPPPDGATHRGRGP